MRASANNTAAAHFAVSSTGTLLYIPAMESEGPPQRTLALADRSGKVTPLPLPPQNYSRPRFSPDGKQLAFGLDDGKEAHVWIYDLRAAGLARRLTFGGRNLFPIWTSDGLSVTFQSNREGDFGLFQQRADGNGSAERLVVKAVIGTSAMPESWHRTGKALTYFVAATGTFARSLMLLTLDGEDKSAPVVQPVPSLTQANSTFVIGWPLATQTSRMARLMKIFVQPFPPTGAKHQLPAEGNVSLVAPVWSANSDRIFYGIEGGSDQLGVQRCPDGAVLHVLRWQIEQQAGSVWEHPCTLNARGFVVQIPQSRPNGAGEVPAPNRNEKGVEVLPDSRGWRATASGPTCATPLISRCLLVRGSSALRPW